MTFAEMIDMWQDRYERAREGADVMKVPQSDEFIRKQPHLEAEYQFLQPLAERFVDLVAGRNRGQTATERAAASSLCSFPRLFDVATVDQLTPSPVAARLASSLNSSFYLGVASHFVVQNHPSRPKVPEINREAFYETFLRESISAEMKMSAYNKGANNIPGDVFAVEYSQIEPTVKNDLRVGFWKRGKVRSNFYNTFCAGLLMPMLAEIQASNR